MPFGLTSTIGARQSAGSVTRCEMLPSPALESGSVAVTAAGVVDVSAPQKSDAEIDVTGPGVPNVGITSPLTVRSSLPSLESVTLPRESTQGRPPGCTPWNIGSVGTLGASVDFNERSPPDAAAIATTATTSAAAEAATSSASLLNGLSQLPPTVAPGRLDSGSYAVAGRTVWRRGTELLMRPRPGGRRGRRPRGRGTARSARWFRSRARRTSSGRAGRRRSVPRAGGYFDAVTDLLPRCKDFARTTATASAGTARMTPAQRTPSPPAIAPSARLAIGRRPRNATPRAP